MKTRSEVQQALGDVIEALALRRDLAPCLAPLKGLSCAGLLSGKRERSGKPLLRFDLSCEAATLFCSNCLAWWHTQAAIVALVRGESGR